MSLHNSTIIENQMDFSNIVRLSRNERSKYLTLIVFYTNSKPSEAGLNLRRRSDGARE